MFCIDSEMDDMKPYKKFDSTIDSNFYLKELAIT